MENLVLFGCGGHSRSAIDLLLSYKPDASVIFLDPNAQPGEAIYGFPVLKEFDFSRSPYFFAIGNNEKRKQKYQEIGRERLFSIQSPKASIGISVQLSRGIFLGNFCHIGPEAKVGDNTILNNGCIIEHEVEIGAHCHIAPRAIISGRCKIKDLVFIGAGAVVKEGISICSHVTVGAGAVIVKDIIEPGTYIGCPGKKLHSIL